MTDKFQILSFDGGGIKGLFSAGVLAHLEEDLGITITDHFDLLVGTSTGGIIALALSIGMKPREVVRFYVANAKSIFPQRPWSGIKHFVRRKYSPLPLESALRECFGDRLLQDCLKRVVITSYNLGEDDVYLFKTPHHSRLKRDYRAPLWKVALATSSAPTYFPATQNVDNIRLVDGGVWANNPIMVGVAEAVSMLGVPLEELKALSLGTTDEVVGRSASLDSGGMWQWRSEAVQVIMRGQSVGAHAQAVHLLGEDRVMRVDPKVPRGLFALDKLSESGLMAKASHISRHIAPQFESTFLEHRATAYVPEHTTTGRTIQC